ncbi:MAG: hypothetical protein JWO38_6854 [Gemmataceae bacterium]|nr:hypothetical protein [Gemmataceae bacterium]
MYRLVICSAVAFLAGGVLGRLTAPDDQNLAGCSLIAIIPPAETTPSADDYHRYEAAIRGPDNQTRQVPVAPAVAEIHARGAKAGPR